MEAAHLQYLQAQVMTAAPERLVMILYDALLRFLNQAKADIEAEHWAQANDDLCKGQAVIAELMSSLDFEYAEFSTNLFELYSFFYDKLVEANVKKSSEQIDELLPMIDELRRAWREIINKSPDDTRENKSSGSSFSAVK